MEPSLRLPLRELRRAAEKFAELELPYATAQARRRAAAAAARAGDRAAALDLLDQAHQVAGQLGARSLQTDCTAALKPRPGFVRRPQPAGTGLAAAPSVLRSTTVASGPRASAARRG